MLGTYITGGDSAGGGGGAACTATVELRNEGGVAEEERVRREEGNQNSAGNRWPREETLALLKIRSEMDLAFREATIKLPLWDEVSRKMGEIGYHRTSKKCKEKFENIYKYHKRTREGRSSREHGKSYRFFEQLEIFDNQMSLSTSSNQTQKPMPETTMAIPSSTIVSKTISASQDSTIPFPTQNPNLEFMSYSTSTTSSSERESEGSVRKKRRISNYFEKLMKGVLEKQENLQNKFLEAIEKCEKDRIAREEVWRAQEMARIKREQEILAHERAVAAANDASVIAFLQKISMQAIEGQLTGMAPLFVEHVDNLGVLVRNNDNKEHVDNLGVLVRNNDNKVNITEKDIDKQENGVGENSSQACSSRWPKAEVEALVRLRSNLDLQYQENGSKGPLWEEISSSMKELGYDRSAKRCKEKWENINKYYKRVKESNKKRPEGSKTCLYFHLLESLYGNKSKMIEHSSDSSDCNLKPEYILMQMMDQEQKQQQREQQHSATEEGESENIHQDQGNNQEDDEYDSEDGYQYVATDPSVVAIME